MKKTLAIFSINKDAYSETFIQAHKNLPFNIKYYYDGLMPTKLEFAPNFQLFNIRQRIRKRFNRDFNFKEHALINSLKKEKVDCVLAEYGLSACASLKVIKFLKLPLVVHFHGFDASNKNIISEYANQYKNVFDYASAVIAVSEKMKTDLLKLGCPLSKLTVATYGPDPSFLRNEPEYLNQLFVAVGRFVEKKAPYITLAAFKMVHEKYPGAKLVMIGDGGLLNVCKTLVSAWGLSNNVEFKGVLNQEEIREVFQASIAFVQHSMVAESGDSEGAPVAILEAQAASLSVISTHHAGIPEVVVDNETGLLVEELDVNGMANNMIRILEEKGLAQKLGIAGRKKIVAKFSREENLISISRLVDNAVNS